jgi:hypothetical protein
VPSSARRALAAVLVVVLGTVLAACAGGLVAPPSQPYGPYPTLPQTGGEQPVGNTTRQYPELSVSLDRGYLIDLVDPEARAWWIVVAGTGANAGDRLEIVAEVGDIWPGAVVNEYVGGQLVDSTDLNGLVGSATAVAGGCHPTLPVCFSSAGIDVRPAVGRLSVTLEATALDRLEIGGATASWDGEPYILGPWRGTLTVMTG